MTARTFRSTQQYDAGPATQRPSSRRRILVVSHVLPFPPRSGQQQRVALTLRALRESFHVTVVTAASKESAPGIKQALLQHCDAVAILPSGADDGILTTIGRRLLGGAYCLLSGEKWSNYIIGRTQFSGGKLAELARTGEYDCVLYEYWHANASTKVFRTRGIPVVLDMHNILWQAWDQQLAASRWVPSWLRRALVVRYRQREENAWRCYDGVIAINKAEQRYAGSRIRHGTRMFHVPMGIPLKAWSYQWQPARPHRIAYYGGLGSSNNQQSAIECVREVMPVIWALFPDAELWLVGSNPSPEIRALASARVKVTGFVADVPSVLRSMTAVLCPWKGTYGFRSRIVEVMALGVPVIATADAVYGMELESGQGLLFAPNARDMAEQLLRLLRDQSLACTHSLAAHDQVSRRFDFSQTYGRLAIELMDWLEQRQVSA